MGVAFRFLSFRRLVPLALVAALGACGDKGFDLDFRDFGSGLDTSNAARDAVAPKPQPDARGVISYPGYQVAIAGRGETVKSVADRLGIDAVGLATHNALTPDTLLREGELLALPGRVAEPAPGTAGSIDVTTLATGAIDRAEADSGSASPNIVPAPSQNEPLRHQVKRGETAYSVARTYNVAVKALAEWNGLGPDLTLREGQFLLIPLRDPAARAEPAADGDLSAPGDGSDTPEPPSADDPLPEDDTATPVEPAAPDLGADRTQAAKLGFPVQGKVIRPYEKGKNEGIDIAAAAGTAVKAAEAGIVAAITMDTGQVPILVLRHDNGLLTVYANIDAITVAKGDRVSRGQIIAKVRAGETSFLHFEVRQGFDSVDPMSLLQ